MCNTRDVLPGFPDRKMIVVQEFGIGRCECTLRTILQFLFHEKKWKKKYLTSHCSGTSDPAHREAWSPKGIERSMQEKHSQHQHGEQKGEGGETKTQNKRGKKSLRGSVVIVVYQ